MNCACLDRDSLQCAAIRYGMDHWGECCECSCHQCDDEDDEYPKIDDAMAGLVRLKRVSPKARQQHADLNASLQSARDRRYAAKSLAESAARLGLKLTKAQQGAILKATESP